VRALRGFFFFHWARVGALALLSVVGLSAAAAPATNAAAGTSVSGPWIELGGGSRGDFLWSIRAGRRAGQPGAGSAGAQQPCLLVAASWQPSDLELHRSTYRECAPTAALSRTEPPLIASAAQPSSGASVKMSAIGMIFAPAARRVRLTLAAGRTESIPLHSLELAHARRVGLPPFRYAAFAIRGEWCAERVVSLSASGAELWDSGVDDYVCGGEDEPQFVP